MGEQYLIDQMVLHIGLYKKYQYKENEIGFYQNLEALRVLKGLNTQDAYMEDLGLTYRQAFNKAYKEVNPPSVTVPFMSFEDWRKQFSGEG